jgi:hypothetical protein
MPMNDNRDRQAILAALYPDEPDEMSDIWRQMLDAEAKPDPNERRHDERKRAREEWEERRRDAEVVRRVHRR